MFIRDVNLHISDREASGQAILHDLETKHGIFMHTVGDGWDLLEKLECVVLVRDFDGTMKTLNEVAPTAFEIVCLETKDELAEDELETLMRAVAPFADEGDYIEIDDEEGTHYRWMLVNGNVRFVQPTIAWPNLEELRMVNV